MLLMLIGSVLGSQAETSDLFLNRLNMSFGINYKYNGLLHHSIDRVWIVTKEPFQSWKISIFLVLPLTQTVLL